MNVLDRLIIRILNEIPLYSEFLTVNELYESSEKLASKYPDKVSAFKIGEARNGEPIQCLKIGEGELNAILFAFPHPNEPIGSMTLEYLSWKLALDDELREKSNTTWYIIKCIDPFGARLNEGWFKGEWSPKKYALNYYRPPGYRQVEWTFPIKYKTLNFNNPVPETEALMKLIDKVKPDFMASLHNAGFCGAYFYLSNPMPELYGELHEAAEKFKIPIHLGEPEVPYVKKLDDAIFKMPSTIDAYEYYAAHSKKDPAEIIRHGGSSDEYAKQVNSKVFTIICEVPYIYDERIANKTPIGVKRRDIILLGIGKSRRMLREIERKLGEIEPYIDKNSPFYEALSEFIRIGEVSLKAEENWARRDPSTDRQATVSEAFDTIASGIYFYGMLRYGLLYRLISEKVEDEPKLKKALKWAERRIDSMNIEFEKLSEYRVIPIRNLVGVQLGAILSALWKLKSI
ncbi:MAG: M14 family zinc carboxypeptidase [archaeon GB-1867-097]|nr:M14 family zinc carboxypeptidase [Candidatus Culexmicrobium thermophilum]